MKNRYALFLASLTGMLLIFSSCQKQMDTPKQDEIMSTPLPGQTIYCRIESIWENPFASDQRFILVLYDEFENPAAITVPMVSTGYPYRTFKYDHWHRLREYLGGFPNGTFQFWHFYGFDLSGRIGVDTTYLLGSVVNNKPSGYINRVISQIQYDGQNRINRVTSVPDVGSPWVQDWSYDGAGNLMRPGTSYDSKINLLRTNDIWMFLARDYSKNNSVAATNYNSTGFPTAISTSTGIQFADTEIQLGHCQIGYGCRPAYW